MKKLLLFLFAYLLFPTMTYAQIGISRTGRPGSIPFEITLGQLITNFLQIMYIIGALGALVFIVWGAMDWILSGGDKEKVAGARKKIINSIVGLTLLSLSLFIIVLIGEILGINILDMGTFPALYENPEIRNFQPRDPNS